VRKFVDAFLNKRNDKRAARQTTLQSPPRPDEGSTCSKASRGPVEAYSRSQPLTSYDAAPGAFDPIYLGTGALRDAR
jgi:hypothetical protein